MTQESAFLTALEQARELIAREQAEARPPWLAAWVIAEIDHVLATARGLGRGASLAAVATRAAPPTPDECAICRRSYLDAIVERTRGAERSRLLARTGDLLGSSLDRAALIPNLARLLVPALGDWCAIDLLDEAGNLVRAASVHARVAHAEVPLAPGTRAPEAPELVDSAPALAARASGAPSSGLESLARVPVRSPLKLWGCLVVAASPPGRYGRDDLELLVEIARRLASALENIRLYDLAQRAIRARDEILAVVAHDLRNPLGSIAMGASLLLRDARDAGEAAPLIRKHAERLKSVCGRMDRLIGDLLDMAAIDAGRLSLERERCDPRALLNEVAERFGGLAAERSLRLAFHAPEGIPHVSCDPGRVVQILANLVGNAVKFTPRGGSIRIAAEAAPPGIRFSVSDTGPGIPAEDLPRIFERFWRGRSGSTGVGLGLAIAKALIEAHGGRIEISSAEGRGTTVQFTLPAAARAQEAA